MAKLVFKRIISLEEIKNILQKNLGSAFQVEVKNNHINVVQDASKGCLVLRREKEGSTTVELSGYMPSGGLRAAIILGIIVLLFIFGWQLGYLVIGIGAIPLILALLLMKIPSRSLVGRIEEIFKELEM